MFWTKRGSWHILRSFDDDGDEIVIAKLHENDFLKTSEVFQKMVIHKINKLAINFKLEEEQVWEEKSDIKKSSQEEMTSSSSSEQETQQRSLMTEEETVYS